MNTFEENNILANIPGGIVKIILDGDTIKPVFISEGWCRMMEDCEENIAALYGKDAMAGVHPDDYDKVNEVFMHAMRTGQPINAVYRVCNSKGVYRWVNNRSSLVSDENGVVNYYAIFTDITDEMKIKQKAEEATKEKELIYNIIPGAVFKCRFNDDFDVIFANDGLFRFLGYTREEFEEKLHNKLARVIYPDDHEVMLDKIIQQLKHGTTIKNENRLICKDGSIKWIAIHAQLQEDDYHEQYFYCTFIDVTEQKKAEAELASTEAKLGIAISHAGLEYWEYDIVNHVAFLNSVSSTDYLLDRVLINYPQSLYESGMIASSSIPVYQNLIDAVNRGEKNAVADIEIYKKNGESTWKRVRFTTLFDEEGKPIRAVATAETINEYKSLEQQFTLAAAQTGMESWIYDFANKTITRTASTGADYGLSDVIKNVPESVVEKESVHKEDAQKMFDLYERMKNGEKRVSEQVRLYRSDLNKYVYYQLDYTVIFDRHGEAERAIGTALDISEKVMLKKRYQEAVQFHHKSFDGNTLASAYCNLSTNSILELNTMDNVNYVDIFGDNRDVFLKNLATCISHVDKREEFLNKYLSKSIMDAYTSGINKQTFSCKIDLDDGSSKYVKFIFETMKQPDTNEISGFFSMNDTTSEIVFDKAIDAVIEKHCDWIVDVDINKDFYKILIIQKGIVNVPVMQGTFSTTNQQYAKTFADQESIDECLEKLSYAYMLSHLDGNNDYWFYYRIKELNEIHTKKIRVFYIDQELGHVGFICFDVTSILQEEQKKNEVLTEALNSSKRANKAKNDFLSRMSHDIRTPMNAIIGMTELTKQEINEKEKALANLDIIDGSANLLLRIINDVLDMSQIESGNLSLNREHFDCFAECQNVVEMAQVMFAQKQQELEVNKEIKHQYFVGDIIRLKRIILNLLNNASKFSSIGGKVKLTAKEEETEDPSVSNLVFEISDSGIGIPEDKLNDIFKPFEQLETEAKYQGTGLGLPIVKSIVEAKGGKISVKSKLNKGSTFTICLPMKIVDDIQANTSMNNKQQYQNIDFSNLRILLVEDHPVNILVATRLLTKHGASVEVAENGLVGLEKFTASQLDQYNLIFMDIQMPIMNGFEAAREIRACSHPQASSIRIIAMTANAFAEDIQKSLESGMNAHIAKPITMEAIMQAIAKCI